jgi:uncharacterized protein (DUF39 family)
LSDEEIHTAILDYGIPSRDRPAVRKASYAELKSGEIAIDNRKVRTSPLSSFKYAKEIAETLKQWILKETFLLSRPAELLPNQRQFKSLQVKTNETKNAKASADGTPGISGR